MVDKPGGTGDWGAAQAAPALPSVQDTYDTMSKGLPATAEQQAAFADNPTQVSQPASVLQRDAKGNVIRPDWNKPPVTVHAQHDVPAKARPDWNAPARNEQGQYVSRSEADMRAQWDREGGIDQVAKIVTAKEQTMYSVAPSLEAKVTEHLDKGFLMKAADHLRLGVSYGPTGFWDSVARFEDSLSPSERDAWGKFCRSLNEDEQAALLYGMSGASR